MKVIELFNKIARNEELPEKIKYENKIWELKREYNDYCCFCLDSYSSCYLLVKIIDDFERVNECLNYELEIIEEQPKKIEKIGLSLDRFDDSYYDQSLIKVADKLDEIIDYINEANND